MEKNQSVCPACGYPTHAGHASDCPLVNKNDTDAVANSSASDEELKTGHGRENERFSSPQFKKLAEVAGEETALKIYKTLEQLGAGAFKDSKLRTTDGELMIVWHGSPRKFDEFKTDAKGEFRWRNEGVHFSSSREVIEQYADKAFSALRHMLYDIAVKEHGIKYGDPIQSEQLKKAKEIYNQLIQDVIEKGEDSAYYKKGYSLDSSEQKIRKPDLDALTYNGEIFGTEWVLEIFNGQMPTKENTYFDEGNGVYLGNDVGRYEYAAVMDIEQPYQADSTNMDYDFEQGEQSHREHGTDGTILTHTKGAEGNGGVVEQTKGTYSAAIYDAKKIKILGRKQNGKFIVNPNS